MKDVKKTYEKPELKCAKVLEASAQTCCRESASACKNTDLSAQGKDQRTSTAS